MISFVIASNTPAKFKAMEKMLAAALGDEPWEVLGAHRAPSLARAYNQAFLHAHGDIIVFCHDDITIISSDFPSRLKEHLSRFDIVGVAGTTRLVTSAWVAAGAPYIFGQIVVPGAEGSLELQLYNAPRPVVGHMQAVDGVFMAMRRPVLDQCRFDEIIFDGFHLYDLDFCLSAFKAGFRLAVANDINLFHQSRGSYNSSWERYAPRFGLKWASHLDPSFAIRAFQWRAIEVKTLEEAAQLMNPAFWREE